MSNNIGAFIEAIAQRFNDEMPEDLFKVMPKMSTEEALGKAEYARLHVKQTGNRQVTIGGKGKRSYDFFGLIIVQIFVPVNEGIDRGVELSVMAEDMWRGRTITGFRSVTFTNVHTRSSGRDDTGRYDTLLTEATFRYRQIL